MGRKGRMWPPDPSKMPGISRVLNDIAQEIDEGKATMLHAQWLRNIAKVLDRQDAGSIVFDRRTEARDEV